MFKYEQVLACVILLVCFFSSGANAVVKRHDVPPENFTRLKKHLAF